MEEFRRQLFLNELINVFCKLTSLTGPIDTANAKGDIIVEPPVAVKALFCAVLSSSGYKSLN